MTGTGDGDLYVKFGSEPTTTSYDCRPYASSENCTFEKGGEDLYFMVKGYRASEFKVQILAN